MRQTARLLCYTPGNIPLSRSADKLMDRFSKTTREKKADKYAKKSRYEQKAYNREMQRVYQKRHSAYADRREKDFWDYVPTEFRTQSVLMEASGAGFTSMWEDRNPRSVAIHDELAQKRFAPPFETKPKTASPKSLEELYSNMPEFGMINKTPVKAKRTLVPNDSMLSPSYRSAYELPFPIGAKQKDPYGKSNYDRRKDPKFDSRV
eukprot:Rhum_TRINITY_DN25182_c0_g1::Rhum_TRINITY_DN25182_c0_g1_i1::g.181413::m.181413